MAQQYIAFISYRHLPLDTAVARRLHRMIERYHVPRDQRKAGAPRLGRVFRDRDELPLTNDLTAELHEALDNAEFLIVVCTPDTPKSQWVDREIEYFLQKHDRRHVLAVLAAGTQENAFPRRLTEVRGEDGVTVIGQVEPLAANISDEASAPAPPDRLLPTRRARALRRLRGEFLRLAAALLGCPYDTLRQRERLYRLQQALAAALAAAAVLLLFVVTVLDRNREIARQMALAQQSEQRALASEAQAQASERAAQRSESYALGLLSEQQLVGGDRLAAIETALAGLPAGGGSRAWHAAAEAALADALYLYQPASVRPAGIVKTEFDIEDARLSGDGSRLILLDGDASMVHCCDTASGRQLWSTPADVRLTRYGYTAFVPWEGERTALLYAYVTSARVWDLEDGSLLASLDLTDPAEGYPLADAWAVTPDGHTLAAVYEPNEDGGDLLLAFRDLRTGALLDTRTLPYGGPLFITHETLLFDEDGRCWALLVRSEDRDDVPEYQAVYAGATDGWTVTFQAQYPGQPDDNNLCGAFLGYGRLAVVRMEGLDAGDPVQVLALDAGSGAVQYRNTAPLPADVSLTETPRLFPLNSLDALLVYDKMTCQVYLPSGRLSPQASLTGGALCARLDGGTLYVAEQTGTLAALPGEGSASFPRYEALYSAAGPLRAAAAADDAAAFCLLPEEDERTAYLYAPLEDDGYRQLPLPEDLRCLNTNARLFPLPQSGRLALLNYQTSGDALYLYEASGAGPVFQARFTDRDLPYDAAPLELNGDGQLLITTSGDEQAFWLDTGALQWSGLAGELPEAERQNWWTVAVPNSGTSWFAWMSGTADDRGELASELVFSLHTAASPQKTVDVPSPPGVALMGDFLLAGGNGWAVTSGWRTADGADIGRCWAAWDTAAARWRIIDIGGAAYTTNLCVGDTLPRFAALERDGTCRLYDLETGTARTLARLPGEPYRTVLRFADGDRLLLAFLPDGTLYLLDTETGAVRLTVEYPALAEPERCRPLVQVDETGRDLYIADPGGGLPGLCIDLEDWYLKARLEGFLCWLPGSRELAIRSGAEIRLYPAPDPAVLAARARALLGED